MPLTAGTRLGAYEILGPIGAGGMGEVYRAVDGRLKRHVAIKVLPGAVAAEPQRIARLRREAGLLAALNHPNVAHLYELVDVDGIPALAMELVEGATSRTGLPAGRCPSPTRSRLPGRSPTRWRRHTSRASSIAT